MKMVLPPSYQDATRQIDWLDVVVPYIPVRYYARLCLVSKRFNNRFAPLLWNNPLQIARGLGLEAENGEPRSFFFF
jgi:hypothetical protein